MILALCFLSHDLPLTFAILGCRPDKRVTKLIKLLGEMKQPKQKRILCMNKVDLVEEKKDLLKVAKEFEDLPGYERCLIFLLIRIFFINVSFWFKSKMMSLQMLSLGSSMIENQVSDTFCSLLSRFSPRRLSLYFGLPDTSCSLVSKVLE